MTCLARTALMGALRRFARPIMMHGGLEPENGVSSHGKNLFRDFSEFS